MTRSESMLRKILRGGMTLMEALALAFLLAVLLLTVLE